MADLTWTQWVTLALNVVMPCFIVAALITTHKTEKLWKKYRDSVRRMEQDEREYRGRHG